MTPAQKRAAIIALVLLALAAVPAFLTAIWTRDQRWAETGTVLLVSAVVLAFGVWVADQ